MPDRLKTTVVIYEDDGVNPPTIKREYKTVHFEGEGAPREVEIGEDERIALYGVAQAASAALIATAQNAQAQAEAERDEVTAQRDLMQEQRDAAAAERDAAKAELAQLKAQAEQLKAQAEQ